MLNTHSQITPRQHLLLPWPQWTSSDFACRNEAVGQKRPGCLCFLHTWVAPGLANFRAAPGNAFIEWMRVGWRHPMSSSFQDAKVQLAALAALPAAHQGKLIPLAHAYHLLTKLHKFNKLLHFSYFYVVGPHEPSECPGRETKAEGCVAIHRPQHHQCGERGVARCSDGDRNNIPNIAQLQDLTLK